jgi:hypothetical protein
MKTMQNPAGFRTVFTGSTGINLKQQNRTDHLLQKPDIFSCYRQSLDENMRVRLKFSDPRRPVFFKSFCHIWSELLSGLISINLRKAGPLPWRQLLR